MIGVLLVIGLFVSLLLILDMNEESTTSEWPRPCDKSMKRYRL